MSTEDSSVPYGYCHCGCGQKTRISASTNRKWGHVKGEPRRFLKGHGRRKFGITGPSQNTATTPYGYCQCGCGELTNIAQATQTGKGRWKGEPLRYVRGHNNNKFSPAQADYEIVDTGYSSACWLWTKARNAGGYGSIGRLHHPNPQRHYLAHRYAYEEAFGPIPEGASIDHLCHVRACVNPAHLEAVTHTENMRRAKHVKLSMEAAKEIRKRHAQGTSKYRLAKEYGVVSKTISSVVNGDSWRLSTS